MSKDDLQAIKALLREELEPIKSQLKENTDILRSLEHSAEVNKAEHDKMSNDIAHIQESIKSQEQGIKNIDESIEVIKDIIGHHEVDIQILKRRPV